MKLFNPEKGCMVEMELCDASFEILVASLSSRSHSWGMADARLLAEAETYRMESKQIAQELLGRFDSLHIKPENMACFTNDMPKFYE